MTEDRLLPEVLCVPSEEQPVFLVLLVDAAVARPFHGLCAEIARVRLVLCSVTDSRNWSKHIGILRQKQHHSAGMP